MSFSFRKLFFSFAFNTSLFLLLMIGIQNSSNKIKINLITSETIELEVKYLKDYPEWRFLSNEELKRKTIEIYDDLHIARRNCSKEKKVIKVPNTKVFEIVTPLLLKRGISRIVNANKLIAL